jgi:anti-sigma regulatory factor (Ser/Thr protein kinase)
MSTVLAPVREPTDVAGARRQAEVVAARAGFGQTDVGRAAIVVTELATNLIRHAGGGEILLDFAEGCLRVLALDKGPGMADLESCLRDGYSTAGTRGEGLGAVKRLSEGFDAYSRPGVGAAVLARLTAGRAPIADGPAWAAVCICYPGEEVCGDGWGARKDADMTTFIMADGLGHGLYAHEASAAAVRAFDQYGDRPLSEVLEFIHGALRPTRGAAVSVARVEASRVQFAGVGNVAGVVSAAGTTRKMISHNGTLGHIAKRFQTFDYPVAGPPLVILHSDGLGTSWNLDKYPGLAMQDPALVAAVLYRDFTRGRDDVTVLAFRG